MLRYFIFLIISCALVYGITIFFRLGAHKSVTIDLVKNYPEVALISADHLGPYHKINSVIETVEAWASAHNLPCQRTFGLYLDDPRDKDEARLRSKGGCVLDGVQSLSLSEPLPEGFTMSKLEARQYVVARFEGAPSISPFKVYPKVADWMKEQGLQSQGPVYEIYSFIGQDKSLTEYLFATK